MVKLMLDRFGGDVRKKPRGAASEEGAIECYHVDARLSDTLEEIGSFRFEKVWLVVRYCLEAIWCRFRHGVRAFYYVPAPGKRAALYRDWIVMLLCRPFFRHFVHHWHAVGLGDWLHRHGTWGERWITQQLLGHASLGLALAIPSMRDALWFLTKKVEIVPNGIPDPCPDFDTTVLPRRKTRREARERLVRGEGLSTEERAAAGGDPEIFHVLFIAHCMREKGVFDTLDAVAIANARLAASHSAIRLRLTVAGEFPRDDERAEFDARIVRPDLAGAVEYAGFVSGEAKSAVLRRSDCLCFPTYYHAESFGLVIVEAMAAGLCVVTTRWRATPDLLPPEHTGFAAPRSPQKIADALQRQLTADAAILRKEFLANFTEDRHVQGLSRALRRLEAA
jgi:glycosyltransferase involved in cell wall biosynthesis